MDNATAFYVFGGALAASAVAVSLLGLRIKRFPGRAAPLVALWFLVLIGAATAYAVFHGQDESAERAAEQSQSQE
jgi:putative Mn2+ efflux pump MntP